MTEAASRKIALITGGSRGLGRNTAIHLAQRGVDVVFTYHSREAEAQAVRAEIEAGGGRAAVLQLDSSVVSGFPQFTERLSALLKEQWGRERFDFLVNNAGTGKQASFMETTEAHFDEMVSIHFKGVFFLTQALLPLMENGGRIVNLSSGLARFSLPGMSAYGACKGAVEVLTRYLAKELGERGITVNTVAPGAIETDFGNGRVRDNPEMKKMISAQTALGRPGLPDDIGPMIASLLSDDNRWVNAQRIEVSGGAYL